MQQKPWFDPKSFNLFEYTFKVYQKNFFAAALLSTALISPIFLYQFLLHFPFTISVTPIADYILNIVFSLWGLIPIMVIVLITASMFTQDQPPDLLQALKRAVSHWPTASGTYFGVGIVLLAIYVPLYVLSTGAQFNSPVWPLNIGGLFVYTLIQFIPQTIVLQTDRRRGPLLRIWYLLKDQWWAAFGHTLAIGLLVSVWYGIMILILTWLPLYLLAIAILSFGFILGTPVVFIYQTLLFLMLEARKDNTPAEKTIPAPTRDPE